MSYMSQGNTYGITSEVFEMKMIEVEIKIEDIIDAFKLNQLYKVILEYSESTYTEYERNTIVIRLPEGMEKLLEHGMSPLDYTVIS